MHENNMTRITTILLLGFQTFQSLKYLIFFLFFMIYCVTICGNLLIITLVSYSKSLHSPMYFFLTQLSASDILLISDILPNMLHVVLIEEGAMSFTNCISQFYFFAIAGLLECLLLTVMSYDRYLAICKPLHYTLIMDHRFCWVTVITCWTLSILIMFINTLTISQLQFCGPNIIDYFFCDLDPILELSCSDTTIVQIVLKSMIAVVVVIPFNIITVSYVYIIVTILEIPSINGRKTAFSTCSSHLMVVSIYYGTLFSVYLVPHGGQSRNIAKFLSLLYTVVTPLMNPIIYSLRNKDFKKAVGKLIRFCSFSTIIM
ncbi:olfactory receptor 11L1-like [Mantella aurantiaca]